MATTRLHPVSCRLAIAGVAVVCVLLTAREKTDPPNTQTAAPVVVPSPAPLPPAQPEPPAPPASFEVTLGDRYSNGLHFSRDSTRLLTIGSWAAQLWDTATWKPIGDPFGHGEWSDGLTLEEFNRRQRHSIDPIRADKIRQGGMDAQARRLFLLADGVVVWDIATHKRVGQAIRHNGEPVWEAAITPDGRFIATRGRGNFAHLWDIETGKLETSYDHRDSVEDLQIDPRGSILITTGPSLVTPSYLCTRLWDLRSGMPLRILPGSWYHVLPAVSASGRIAIGWDFGFTVYDMDTGKQLQHVDHVEYSHQIGRSMGISADGTRVVTQELAGGAVWDVKTGKGFPMNGSVSFTPVLDPTGETVVFIELDEGEIWDVQTGHAIRKASKEEWYMVAAFSPDGKMLAIDTKKNTKVLIARPGVKGAARWKASSDVSDIDGSKKKPPTE